MRSLSQELIKILAYFHGYKVNKIGSQVETICFLPIFSKGASMIAMLWKSLRSKGHKACVP